jgi:hypothetical protein
LQNICTVKKRALYLLHQTNQKASDMKTITAHKMNKVTNTDAELLAQGVVAFQIVRFVVDFYGNKIETTHDTKIMKDGRQVVIGGCGYIPSGYELN